VRGYFAEVTRAEDHVDSYRTYTLSQLHLVHAVLPAMQDAGWGRFVHIGSATAKEPAVGPAPHRRQRHPTLHPGSAQGCT
jgi:NADP-dependent 3-hydroxy acid dehydrogenase YdfG